jgi:uncharacterized DUF497 family protein
MPLVFEWDPKKAKANHRKHGVSFDEARTVFEDPLAAIFADEEHSVGENREMIVGHSILRRLVLVCFTERRKDHIRVISARSATRREQSDYEDHFQS